MREALVRRLMLLMVAVAVLSALVVLSCVPGLGLAGRQAARVCTWRTFPVEGTDLAPVAVEALSSSDVWVVGGEYPGYPKPSKPLILHWDGSRWGRADVRVPGATFEAVSSSSPSDVWAVGHSFEAEGGTVAVHWDGVRWRRVPTPDDPRGSNNQLEDVVAVSSTEAWAVGTAMPSPDTSERWPILLHWNGRSWKRVSAPIAGRSGLTAVDASSPTNVWAVGYTAGPVAKGGYTPPALEIALHWNGRKWESTRLPPAPLPESGLGDVSVASNTAAWAIGSSHKGDRQDGQVRHYTIRWIRDAWQMDRTADMPRPLPARGFAGIHAETPTRVWAWYDDGDPRSSAMLARWDGRQWRAGPLVPFPGKQAAIHALDVSPDGALWLTGSYYNGGRGTEVIASYQCRG